MGFFLTQQNRRVIYFAMNNVVVQKIHFACWFVASMCVYTLGNLNVEPALWLQCSVIERLNHTASGSLLKLFLPYCPPLTCSGKRVHRHTGLGFLFMTQRAFCWEVEADTCLNELNHDSPYSNISNSPWHCPHSALENLVSLPPALSHLLSYFTTV